MSGSRRSEARSFNENSPRPPVPGEETGEYISRFRTQSPALTPRRSSLASSSAQDCCDAAAPLGFEPEGCCGTTTMESYTPPACLRWAKSFHYLLKDPEGIKLFRNYLDQEDESLARPLYFWFACNGIKEAQDPATIQHLIKVIYKKCIWGQKKSVVENLKGSKNVVRRPSDDAFLSSLNNTVCEKEFFLKLAISEDVRKEVNRRVTDGRADNRVFDAVQLEVEQLMAETTYPNFLQSEMYLHYVQSCQNPEFGGCSASSRETSLSCGPTPLPTLHEDSEYVISVHNSYSASVTPVEWRSQLRLTKDVLRATESRRALDIRPKPEAYAGIYLQRGTSPYHMSSSKLHAQYSSYNPVSRQDSEVQSLSSDARSGSNLSLTDSSVDGMSIGHSRSSKKHSARKCRATPESYCIKPDSMLDVGLIPRTQRARPENSQPRPPVDFAQQLTEALERLQEEQEKAKKNPLEIRMERESEAKSLDSKALSDALRETLRIEDGNDQAILDDHVSRVWSDPTPSRSPELASPRPHSPDRRQLLPSHNYMRQLKPRKENHVVSTFSVDSGNIQDFAEGSELAGARSMSSLGSHMPKSKSVPSDHADSLHKQDLYLQGHEQRLRREPLRRSATKNSMAELTDSGVSGVSYTPSASAVRHNRIIMKHSCDKKIDAKHGSSGSRHIKSTRSGSLERTGREKSGIYIHPFVADPGMPPLPAPEPAMQLDEAKRKLEEFAGDRLEKEEKARGGSRQRHAPAGKQTYEPTSQSQGTSKFGVQSNQSTLRKSRQDVGEFTTAVFSFCDDELPYRTKIPGRNVTLKQFKEYLPKKGNYRFFFKTACEELDVEAIQEEVTNDADVLPLWKGTVMAKVKALE